MPFLDVMKSILHLEPPKPSMEIIVIGGADSLHGLPQGFFNVETASGKKSLGYNSPPSMMMLPDQFLVDPATGDRLVRQTLVGGGELQTFDCGETVVDRGKRITLDKPRSELPTVKLNYRRNAHTALGHSIIETDADDCEVGWSGAPPSSGVQLR
jgi:hypothetical protein